MQNLSLIVKRASIVILMGITMPAFAESAPVYDADSLPPQFETVDPASADQDLPPPPPPGQEGAFIPRQQAPVSMDGPPLTVDQRVKRVEQQLNNMQTSGASDRIDSLQNQVQNLRGQVEQLTHQIEQMQVQQKAMYSDLDKRLAQSGAAKSTTTLPTASANNEAAAAASLALKTAANNKAGKIVKPTATTPTPAAGSDDQPNVAEELQIYQTAYNLIKAKKYEEAVNTLQGMLKKYPSGQFASNAHYWLGELYGLMGKNDQALTEFNTVLKTYPDSPRVSDAQLKVGLIYASQSKWSDAKASFKKVINRYPGSASARLAAEHLKQIKQAGS
jgi:tol-pal system protein YbgF